MRDRRPGAGGPGRHGPGHSERPRRRDPGAHGGGGRAQRVGAAGRPAPRGRRPEGKAASACPKR
jgi:hypothetical protein